LIFADPFFALSVIALLICFVEYYCILKLSYHQRERSYHHHIIWIC